MLGAAGQIARHDHAEIAVRGVERGIDDAAVGHAAGQHHAADAQIAQQQLEVGGVERAQALFRRHHVVLVVYVNGHSVPARALEGVLCDVGDFADRNRKHHAPRRREQLFIRAVPAKRRAHMDDRQAECARLVHKMIQRLDDLASARRRTRAVRVGRQMAVVHVNGDDCRVVPVEKNLPQRFRNLLFDAVEICFHSLMLLPCQAPPLL